MNALAVTPRRPNSARLIEIATPRLADVPNGRGVLVRVLQVGIDATDGEINQGLYGNAPPGDEHLVLGHEVFGQVEAVGQQVTHVQPGDYCTCTVRRPGPTIYDRIGRNDITSHEEYYERGINLLHGFLTERFVDDAEFIVKVPAGLKHLGVLAEPASVCAKAIEQAYLAQQRLQVWEPKVAWVMGAGQIGLLTTMMLRLRGLQVFTIARTTNPGIKEEICRGYGAEYVGTGDRANALEDLRDRAGRPDLVVEATGSSRVAFECMRWLNLNGALVWTSVTGGTHKLNEFPADQVNLEWVLGNKLLVGSVNGNRHHFAKGLADLALAETMFAGVTKKILTHPIEGICQPNRPKQILDLLEDKACLKVFVTLSPL